MPFELSLNTKVMKMITWNCTSAGLIALIVQKWKPAMHGNMCMSKFERNGSLKE